MPETARQKKKIRFTIQADALTLGDMEDRETCSLFSNLLDNAVEAADQGWRRGSLDYR